MGLLKKLLASAVLAGAGAFGLFLFWSINAPSCTTRILDAQRAIDASDAELRRVSSGDRQAQCVVYRQRVAVLTDATPVSAACGSPQAMPPYLRPIKEAELGYYRRLVTEACG